MSPKVSAKPQISAENFPALRAFLRGYFHQDLAEEYGSPEEAARQFCEDADSLERKQVAGDWKRFVEQTKRQPLAAINRLLTQKLGSSVTLTDSQIAAISSIFENPHP